MYKQLNKKLSIIKDITRLNLLKYTDGITNLKVTYVNILLTKQVFLCFVGVLYENVLVLWFFFKQMSLKIFEVFVLRLV